MCSCPDALRYIYAGAHTYNIPSELHASPVYFTQYYMMNKMMTCMHSRKNRKMTASTAPSLHIISIPQDARKNIAHVSLFNPLITFYFFVPNIPIV